MIKIISIIIPAFNEEKFIGICLESLCNIQCCEASYEVLLIDNGSTDNTCKIASSFLGILDFKIIVKKNVNVSALRNLGASLAKGSIFAFLDADCTVSTKWLCSAVPYFDNPEIAAVGSSHLTPEDISWIATTWDLVIEQKRKKGFTAKLPSGNLWVARDKFLAINGFNEDLVTNEDFDLCYRLSRQGSKIYSDPLITAWHWGVPRTLGEFYKKNKWHGTHVLKVFLEDFPRCSNLKPLLFGLYYLGLVILIPVVFIYYIFPYALLINIVLLLGPPLSLSWRVMRYKHKSFASFFKLSALYFVYGIARAHSIFDSIGRFF